MNNVPAEMAATQLERASLTAKLSSKLNDWHHRGHLGSFGARTIGLIATPLTCLIDAFVHAFIFVGKLLTGVFVTPYNAIVKAVNPASKYAITTELELSSALVHICRVMENLFRTAVLPVVMLLNPDRGNQLAQQHEQGFIKTFGEYTRYWYHECDRIKQEMEEELRINVKVSEEEFKEEISNLEACLKEANQKLEEVSKVTANDTEKELREQFEKVSQEKAEQIEELTAKLEEAQMKLVNDDTEALREQIQQQKALIEKLQADVKKPQEETNRLEEQIKELQDAIKDYQKRHIEDTEKKMQLTDQIEELQKQLPEGNGN